MKKRILGAVIVVIGVALLLVVVPVVIMFLAPGTEIYGIRYVASGTSKCEIKENLNDYVQGFTGDLYIETQNVPIEITFSESYSYYLEFCQNFIGFTKSKDKKANLSINQKNGDLYVKANEIEEFVYSQKADTFFRFKLYLPVQFNSGSRSLNIKSKTSSVTFVGNARLKDFTMESEGALKIPEETSSLTLSNKLTVETSKILELKKNVSFNSCELSSSGNSIVVANNVPKDIVAKTKGGDLKFVSCNNLTFSSTSGSLKAYGTGENIVRGKLNAKTKGGNISISKILGEVEKLETSNGSIKIGTMVNGTISSTRGKVSIDNANDITIKSNTGNVSVKNVSSKITIKGRNGKVSLGEGGVINNPTVNTTTGKISVYQACGVVNIKSENNDVVFENKSSENITLYSGKKLKANGLKGTVEAYSKKDASYSFSAVSGNVKIKSGSRADKIKIDMTCARISDVDYDLKSTKGTKAKVYSGNTLVAELSKIKSEQGAPCIITVETSYAEIVLKFKEENNVA